MSGIVCQVINQANRAEFTWSQGGGSFRPYVVEGMEWQGLRDLCQQARAGLAKLVDALNRGAPEAEHGPLAYGLAEVGFKLYNRILPNSDPTSKSVRTWLEGSRGRSDALGLEVVLEERSTELGLVLAVPWNLVYDQPAIAAKAAFLHGKDTERWRPFWGVRYKLTSGRRVEPWRRAPVWKAPKVIVVIDPQAYETLAEDSKTSLDALLAECELEPVHSIEGLQETLLKGYPHFLYWFGHATPNHLLLGDTEAITPGELRDLFDAFGYCDLPEGMIAFLNACQTAEVGQSSSFLQEMHKFGFAGVIATEQQTIDTFANEFGLRFLRGFLLEGKSLGDLLHFLRRENAPLGLIYGAHCPPEIRIQLDDTVVHPPSIRESEVGPGTPFGSPHVLPGSRALPLDSAGRALPFAGLLRRDGPRLVHRPRRRRRAVRRHAGPARHADHGPSG